MASRVLYPPVLDSYMPAFQAGSASKCRVYFSLSKFNVSSDFSSLHVSIVKQNSGINVVNTKDDTSLGHYRATGIILNMKASAVEGKENLYYFDIVNSDLSSKDDNIGIGYEGWIPGWIYKIQIRLSARDYDGSVGQAAWVNNNSAYFSEWSTVCTVKAIGKIDLAIPPIDFDSSNENDVTSEDEIKTLYISTLDFFGKITSEDKSEVLYKYNFKLYNADGGLIEDSGDLFSNQYQDCNEFRYLVKTEFEDNKDYSLSFTYTTNNYYSFTYSMKFSISLIQIDKINCNILTVDNDTEGILDGITSKQEEEEEGRIGLKLYSNSGSPYSGNICIRRSSSKDQFKEWVDIKIYTAHEEIINDIKIIYDYSIESGVWYMYGVQSIDKDGNRGILNISSAVMRNFEYSYLLGENEQQLKLMFNNTMGSYKIQLMESKTETIGGIYPTITRNAALRYRIFPINGLISFWMDENNLFCNKKVIYNDTNIVELYEKYNLDNNIVQYDYIYERDFRKLVLDFLHDGKPKLFKSPTEGNIIVRLTDINCVPNQSLDRMLYEFSSTGNELAEATTANYQKYGFINPGSWESNIYTYETKVGQIQMEFTPQTNVFYEIYKKYDSQGKNLGGYDKVLQSIHHIKITIDDKPLRIMNSAGELVVGNNFTINGLLVTIYDPRGIYEFDSRLKYTAIDQLYLLGDAEGLHPNVNATIDFLYEIRSEVYHAKQVQTREVKTGIGQIFGEYQSDVSIYNEIYYKYYIEWNNYFRRLNKISSIEIEANPDTVFLIRDESENLAEEHEIGDTGILRLYELNNITQIKYLGIRNRVTGDIDSSKPANVLINYYYSLTRGTYKGES